MKQITSFQNPLVKHLVNLTEKSRTRKQSGQFVIEGVKEILLAVEGGYDIETVLFSTKLINAATIHDLFSPLGKKPELIELSHEVYAKSVYRENTEGIVAIAKTRDHNLEKIRFKTDNPLILVAEAPEKPGNIGALLRTADAAGVDAVIIANPHTDLYNPNIVRSSVGTLFTVQIGTGSTDEVIQWLQNHKISIYNAHLEASEPYTGCDFTGSCAIVVGTESTGLTPKWQIPAAKNILIPMYGKVDSMNMSVSAAIIVFEAVRQRIQKKKAI